MHFIVRVVVCKIVILFLDRRDGWSRMLLSTAAAARAGQDGEICEATACHIRLCRSDAVTRQTNDVRMKERGRSVPANAAGPLSVS